MSDGTAKIRELVVAIDGLADAKDLSQVDGALIKYLLEQLKEMGLPVSRALTCLIRKGLSNEIAEELMLDSEVQKWMRETACTLAAPNPEQLQRAAVVHSLTDVGGTGLRHFGNDSR